MAHFFGTVQGSRGEATRTGTKSTGMHVTACSWAGKVRVMLDYDAASGGDIAHITLDKHHGKGVERVLYSGPVGEFEPDPVRVAAQAMLDAFGSDTPDWLRAEATALENALRAGEA